MKEADEILQRLARNIETACIYLKDKIKENLNTDQPYKIYYGNVGVWYAGLDPSSPGDFPKKVRGDLQKSIAHEMEGLEGRVGTNLEIANHLEFGTTTMAARPFLRATADQEQAKIAQILER